METEVGIAAVNCCGLVTAPVGTSTASNPILLPRRGDFRRAGESPTPCSTVEGSAEWSSKEGLVAVAAELEETEEAAANTWVAAVAHSLYSYAVPDAQKIHQRALQALACARGSGKLQFHDKMA